MTSQNEIQKIREVTGNILQKMAAADFNFNITPRTVNKVDVIDIDIQTKNPQVLIGLNGQTLSELERILKIILNKNLKKSFYLKLDINGYKEKKINYLKSLAQDIANEVSFTKKAKTLFPMPAYQRRIIHIELAGRQDILTESRGDRENRRVVINPLSSGDNNNFI